MMMTRRVKIEAFLRKELARENRHRKPVFVFLTSKIQELYWTITKLIGLERLHDGRWRTPHPTEAETLRQDFIGDAPMPPANERIFIDVTATHRYRKHTGVQRVVREIAYACVENGSAIPVVIEDGKLFSHFRHNNLSHEYELAAGDKLFLLDSGWGFWQEYQPIIAKAQSVGVQVIGCLYDIIPLLYPDAVERANGSAFEQWFQHVLLQCDGLISISESVAREFIDYVAQTTLDCAFPPRLGWFQLGADFKSLSNDDASDIAQSIVLKDPSFFMSVGTVEPRKAYPVALEAFERLWAQGFASHYVIVGRPGWNTKVLQKQILSHKEYGRKLFWLANASDADLALLYKHARALIFPSFAEGFGMPLIEAMYYGAQVIASDIPVFKEVGGKDVTYFSLLDVNSLADAIKTVNAPQKNILPPHVMSWRQSASAAIEMIRNEHYQFSLDALQREIAAKCIVPDETGF